MKITRKQLRKLILESFAEIMGPDDNCAKYATTNDGLVDKALITHDQTFIPRKDRTNKMLENSPHRKEIIDVVNHAIVDPDDAIFFVEMLGSGLERIEYKNFLNLVHEVVSDFLSQISNIADCLLKGTGGHLTARIRAWPEWQINSKRGGNIFNFHKLMHSLKYKEGFIQLF